MSVFLLILFGTSPLLAAVDAASISDERWPRGAPDRRRWITRLVVTFFLPPLGPLVALWYLLLGRPSTRSARRSELT